MAKAKLSAGIHDGKEMHLHIEGRCKGKETWIMPGDTFGLHEPGQCSDLPRGKRGGYTEEGAGEEEIEGPKIKRESMAVEDLPKGPKECCGSKGTKHMKGCPAQRRLAASDGKPLEGYLTDYRSDCCGGLVVPGTVAGYRCIECRQPCQTKKMETPA